MHKVNNTNNKSTGTNNASNGAEGNNNSCIHQIIIKHITAQALTNGIKPLKIHTKYIRHAYDLHTGVGIKFQSHPRRQHY